MNFNFDNNIPIYIQLVDNLKMDIISGKISPGDKLPSIRELSSNLKVNPNTIQRALIELEDLKLIYTERTNGKYVTSNIKLINKYKEEYAENIINNYLLSMQKIGFTKKEAILHLNDKGGKE